MIDPIIAFGVARGVLSAEAHLYTEPLWTRSIPVLPVRRKLRVLALHGFGQSGEYLRIAMKTRQLSLHLMEMLEADMINQYDGVEWLCPDGPVKLLSDTNYDNPAAEHVAMRAWWRVLDFGMEQHQLYSSLQYLCEYLKNHGPVDGIVGFSQGAAIGMMLTALCEGSHERMAALATQGSPVPGHLRAPQGPFKFAVSCCGFQGPLRYYDGFYSPRIFTPSLHVVAEFDTMVSEQRSSLLASACEDATVIHFRGSHHVPTDKASLYEMARFVANTTAEKSSPPSAVGYVLPLLDPGVNLKTVAKVAVREVSSRSDFHSPTSPASSSPPSSLSDYSASTNRRPRLRVIQRTTRFRSVSNFRRIAPVISP